MRAGESLRRPVPRIVVQEPAGALLRSRFLRPLEVLSLQRKRETKSRGKRKARRPDLDVHAVDFTGSQLLRLVVRVPGLPFGGAQRIELSLRDAQPPLRDLRLGLASREKGDFPPLRIESAQR